MLHQALNPVDLQPATRTLLAAYAALFPLLVSQVAAQSPTITGELKVWHRVELTFDGPSTSEAATPNPFVDYALEVTFTKGDKRYVVPGFYAADGDAAETSATAGDKWRVRFAPDEAGTWNWSASFRTGDDVAIGGGPGQSAGFFDGTSGSFSVSASDKTGRDHRGKGRLEYVGEHYLRYAGTGEWFVKAGADAPENTLAYEDFDDVPDQGGRRKSWQPHQQDYRAAEAAAYTWQGGKGSELLGAVSYLASTGVNAFSFLTFSTRGDDRNVFPHLLRVPLGDYGGDDEWTRDLHHDRFDVSRLAQWERIFSYADAKGMYLHFKLQETENDGLMDGGDVGRERKAYYRELIARFGHHLALNWNMGEENTQSTAQRKAMAAYFAATDPYDHLRVIHTYPGDKERVYGELLGGDSEFTGVSLQTNSNEGSQNFDDALEWRSRSATAGKKWVVAVDEPGDARTGVDSDPRAIDQTRTRVVWASLMAGGAGTEFYYGYQSGCGDLNCEDHRSRDRKYTEAGIALTFFRTHFQRHLPHVANADALTADGGDYVLAKTGTAYAVYRPSGGSTAIDLPSGAWRVRWFNPRTGVMSNATDLTGGTLVAPDDQDWVALVEAGDCSAGQPCDDGDACTADDVLDANCDCAGVPVGDDDEDGVCDAEDRCPNFDDARIGTPCDDGDASTENDVVRGDCSCAGTAPGQQTSYWLEAECGTFGAAWAETTDARADGQAALAANGTETFTDAPPDDARYAATFDVDVEVAGTYRLAVRSLTSADDDDSLWIRIGDGTWVRWNKIGVPYSGDYAWAHARQWDGGDAFTERSFPLDVGAYTITVAYREPGIRIDKLLLTTESQLPTGLGERAGNCAQAPDDAPTGLDDEAALAAAQVRLFPNPVGDLLTVRAEGELTHLEVYNTMGSVLLRAEPTRARTQTLELTDLPPGLYLVRGRLDGRPWSAPVVRK